MARSAPPLGVLLLQLGTPDAPNPRALRRYLRQFLSDPRVIEVPRPIWWLILNLAVLPFRPRASARKYMRVWTAERGSPLLHFTRRQRDLLAGELGDRFAVEFGMRYGNPSIGAALDRLLAAGAERIVAVPLYPQYAASSTASALDELFRVAARRRVVPALHVVPPFFDDPGYLDALATRFRETLTAAERPPDHVLVSFHGLPVKMIERGDPYRDHCLRTAALLAERLKLGANEHSVTFQSRFGREAWLEPYTEATLVELARKGARRVLVVQPGFVADCLETLDEIGYEGAEAFRHAGGESLTLVPCLNDHPTWIAALVRLVRRETGAWADG